MELWFRTSKNCRNSRFYQWTDNGSQEVGHVKIIFESDRTISKLFVVGELLLVCS